MKNNKPLVSVLIPVFNRCSYIGECIESALCQNFDAFEVVIVDNASDDGTWEICLEFASRDSRVRVFRNHRNLGPVRNWAKAAELARGEFSKVLFSDDLLEKNCLSEMVPELLDSSDTALVFCGAAIGRKREDAKQFYINPGISSLTTEAFLNLLLNGKAPLSPGAVLLRSDDLRRHLQITIPTAVSQPFDEHGAGPDVLLLLNTADQYRLVKHVDRLLVFFRAHDDSISVANKDFLVSKGYASALSFYLAESKKMDVWFRYVARLWLIEVKRLRTWVPIRVHLQSYEGSGSHFEQLRLIYEAGIHLLFYFFGIRRCYV